MYIMIIEGQVQLKQMISQGISLVDLNPITKSIFPDIFIQTSSAITC